MLLCYIAQIRMFMEPTSKACLEKRTDLRCIQGLIFFGAGIVKF